MGSLELSSGLLSPQFDSGKTWDGAAWVKEVRRSTAARNWGGGRAHLRFVWVKIPANPRAGVGASGLGADLVFIRSFCEALPGLWRSGAPGSRWRRDSAPAMA